MRKTKLERMPQLLRGGEEKETVNIKAVSQSFDTVNFRIGMNRHQSWMGSPVVGGGSSFESILSYSEIVPLNGQ